MDQESQNRSQDTSEKKNSSSSLLCNIFIPVLCLLFLPKFLIKLEIVEESIAGKIGLLIALSFPIAYFFYHFVKEKKASLMSVVGFLGILITGLIGILDLPREYVAYERAAVPLIFAIAIIVSNYTSKPLVKAFFYNPMMFNTEKIDKLLEEHNTQKDFKKALNTTSYILVGSFIFSSLCNYVVTQHYMLDESMTFNDAYAKVKLMSMAITFVPLIIMMVAAIFYFQKQLTKLTGVENAEELYSDSIKEKGKDN